MPVALTPEDYLKALQDKFGWLEYLVFGLVLASSAGIGVFYGFFSKREKNNEEFLMGGRSMSAWPVALSLMCSFVSGITVLGNPVETYLYGTQYATIILSFIPLTAALQFIYVPVYFKLQLTSAFQYFEIRFNTAVRTVLSLITCFYLIFYMALVVYGPSIALNQVTGFNTLLSVAIIFIICVFYSTLGGFRAVLWTDALQAVVMMVSLAIVAIKGTVDVGGFAAIWEKLEDTERVSFFRFDPDPRARHSVWAVSIGGLFLYLTLFGGTQANIQRYSSMPDIKTVTKALLLNYVFLTITILLCTYCGLIIFTRFHSCDPISANLVETTDQILPLFVLDILGDIPCLPGLFVAGITCASLSSVSSCLNAMAAILVEDYIIKYKPDMSESLLFNLSRLICVLTGVVSFAFIFVVRLMGEIFPAAVSLIGMFLGPTLGLFTLGMCFPWANSLGALFGVISSYVLVIFIGVGSAVASGNGDLPDQRLSLSTHNCSEFFTNSSTIKNVTHAFSPADTWKDQDDNGLIQLFTTSYLFFPLLGCLGTIVFGLIVSAISDALGWNKDGPIPSDCMSPPIMYIWRRLFPQQMARLITEDNSDLKSKTSLKDSRSTISSGEAGEDYKF
ncbi:unnamed protein product [Orchesella dallaii]|uniref:Sodium-coupled monocarboxylate transporter 1 n=1 Tax=Orchesella dallaii TaxID=48710 RepID=A0ABP1QNT8_9HEXA